MEKVALRAPKNNTIMLATIQQSSKLCENSLCERIQASKLITAAHSPSRQAPLHTG